MSKKSHSSFLNENNEVSSVTNSIENDSLFFGSCIAISPDSQRIITFSQETRELKLININDLSSSKRIFTLGSEFNGEHDKHLCWSLAISNYLDDDKIEYLIALSCFDARGFRHDKIHGDDKNDIDFGDKVNNKYGDDENDLESCNRDDENDLKYGNNCQTWVISAKERSEIHTLESIGGVIRFLDWDDNNDKTMKRKKRKQGFFLRPAKMIKQYELPQQLSIRLSRDHWHNSLELLHISIIKNHFMVQSFENRQQIIEMYSLITGDLEMLFKRHESSLAPNIIHGSPIFAISQNEKILAFCRGTTSITLYLMENGLEITTKQLEGQRGIYKIIAINFIDDDSKLLIVLEEKEYRQGEYFKHQTFVVWDLFTTFENSIRQIDYSETKKPLKTDVTHRLMNHPGNMFAVRDSGDIISVLDHKDVALIRSPSTKEMTKIDIITGDHVYNEMYSINGKRPDASKLVKNRTIIYNVEPWHPNDGYFRLSVYLDFTESTQLIISRNTIQVWKYRNNTTVEKRDRRRDRVLEYIWARKKVIDVQELRIGEREFVLKVLIPSTKRFTPPKSMTIHWPNNVNVLEGACRALYVLSVKKHIVTGHENVYQVKYLIECTERLVRKYIKKYGIFRLTSIRYPIMKYLIKSYQENLIKHILNVKINNKHSNIYIPRLYKWEAYEDNNRSTTEISKSDLHHAILCIQRGDPKVILKYLIDYYADNAKEYNNHGWMFTISEAIPLLYDSQLSEFVQYLFKKPCFGTTEAYTPPLNINPYDQKKGNNAAVIHSLAVKPCLAPKFHNTIWIFLENLFKRFEASHNDRKVYIVPLPDFTVYPKDPKVREDHSENYSKYSLFAFFRISFWPRRKVINNTKEMSPFLRVIHEEKGYEIFQTPTIMAVLDFKWSEARRYFIRHIFIYIFYAISYTVTIISYSFKGESSIVNLFKIDSNILLTICLLVYLYTGWYLIVTEIVLFKRKGWRRYMLCDLLSVLLPLASFLYEHQVIILSYSIFNSVLAFIVLVMWLQFVSPGRFIYIIMNILNTIWPFFAFMLIAVLAFGHAMFILLNYADNLQVPTYKISDTSNPDLYSNITIYQNIDKSSLFDNYYSNFFSSVEAVFFWINGRWDQLDQWDSYAVSVISILGSMTLVLIFQNMLIAFMNDTFDKANKHSRTAAHKYRAELVADYESLEKPFGSIRGNPRYIYYIPDPDVIDNWLTETKKDEKQKLRLMDNSAFSIKYRHKHEGSESTVNLDSIIPVTINKISVIDEEIFLLKVYNKSSNYPDPATDVDDRLLIQERFNNLEIRFNNLEIRFNNLETRLEQNFKTILKTLNKLNNDV
ncbi:7995_t:CDS:10 [Diversispora eburnea]|uniref:7995_t:CDS:1 n=1 Tax=Diversispora eburnea TaxID=1213867 RepID=A0A9N8VP74_9GLOM|nr:7995_t:CDS:10 [Diversispora eburnea]